MTMQEYVSRKNINHLPAGTVELTDEDIINHGETIVNKALKIKARAIEVKAFGYTYRVDYYFDGSFVDYGWLYTMDDHGNKKAASVFKLKSPLVGVTNTGSIIQ